MSDSSSDFWTGLRDSFTSWFSPQQPAYTGYQPQESITPAPGGPAEQGGVKPSPYGDTFRSIGQNMLPGLAQAGAGALINKALPSTPSRIVAPDLRSSEGMAADQLRLQNAGSASKALASARAGELDPFMEQQIRKRVRGADAARGALETGGSKRRETTAIQEELNRVINREGGNVSAMTSGYPQSWAHVMPAAENPWAKVLTAAIQPGIGKTTKELYDKWFI